METLNYKIQINGPIQKVWDLLWNPETYTQWTQFFTPGSTMKSDWQIGGQTYFLDPSGNGMVSTILNLDIPNEVIFSHLGSVKNGVEDIESREVKEWSGAQEKYFLRAIDSNTTELRAIVHVNDDYQECMNEGFNKGFQLLKEIAES